MSYPLSSMADRLWMYRLVDRQQQALDRDMPGKIGTKFKPWCLNKLMFCAARGPWLAVFDPLQQMSDRNKVYNMLIFHLGMELDVISLDAQDLVGPSPKPGLPTVDSRALAVTIEVVALSQQVLGEVLLGSAELLHVAQRMALNDRGRA